VAFEHRLGSLALVGGQAANFGGVGVPLGMAGGALGLEAKTLRILAAFLMRVVALRLLAFGVAARFSSAAEHLIRPFSAFAARTPPSAWT
jgi:cytochrome c biogenesis protein CcdA